MRLDRWLRKTARRPVAYGIAGITALVAILALGREYATFGVETDFLGQYINEAQRWLAGEPFKLTFQPPVYPMVLAAGFLALGDWLVAGLVVSLLSVVCVLAVNVRLFQRLCSDAAGWGSLLALGTSTIFLRLGATASTDLFFLALYSVAMLAAVAAFQEKRTLYWMVAGIALGLSTLTRTNGMVLLLLLGLPMLLEEPRRQRLRASGWALAGGGSVWALWIAIANGLGSPLYPTDNYTNLASTYFFSGDGVSTEAVSAMRAQFDSVWAVLLHDPLAIVQGYLSGLAGLLPTLFGNPTLVAFPIGALAAAGVIALVFNLNRLVAGFAVITAAHIALLNLQDFHPRYYLFLVPALGAAAAIVTVRLFRSQQRERGAFGAGALLALLLLGYGLLSIRHAHGALHGQDSELEEAVPAARDAVEAQDLLVARKPHLPYYAGASEVYFPDVKDFAALRDTLTGLYRRARTSVYLYYGSMEERRRPGFKALLEKGGSPSWLTPVARGHAAGWALFRLDSEQINSPDLRPEEGHSGG